MRTFVVGEITITMQENFEQVARGLIDAGQYLFQQGMVPATSGNFSARIGDNRIAITVSGRHKGRLTLSDIMQIDEHGKSLDGQRSSAETALHIQIYKRIPGAGVILHHHSLYATLLSQLVGDSVELVNYELLKAFPNVVTHEVSMSVPVFENSQDIPGLATRVDAYMEENSPVHGYLIKGHGLYTWGEDFECVLRHVEAFEFLFRCELLKRGMRPL